MTVSTRLPALAIAQFPRQHNIADRDGLTAIGLPPPVPPLDHCPVPIELDQPIPIHQPQEPGAIDPGKGPFAVGAKQIERSPAERRRLLGPTALRNLTSAHHAIAAELVSNPRGLLLVRDELAGWIGGMDLYSRGDGNDRPWDPPGPVILSFTEDAAVALQAFRGGSYRS
jgi:hypothetical protein